MNPLTSTPIKPIDCNQTRKAFSGYLDGVVGGREMLAIAAHLEDCNNCADEFAAWRGVQQALGQMGKLQAPPDLGLKLRLAISHESARRQGRWRDEFSARWENLVRPMVLQVSAGLAGTLVLLGSLAMMIGVVAAPEAVLANDEPLGALTAPHFLYSSAPSGPLPAADDTPIVIQALVNAEGRVYDYTIVSGPRDPATLSQVRDELMLQVYAPARVFGEAVRGHVLITFAGVSVKG